MRCPCHGWVGYAYFVPNTQLRRLHYYVSGSALKLRGVGCSLLLIPWELALLGGSSPAVSPDSTGPLSKGATVPRDLHLWAGGEGWLKGPRLQGSAKSQGCHPQIHNEGGGDWQGSPREPCTIRTLRGPSMERGPHWYPLPTKPHE